MGGWAQHCSPQPSLGLTVYPWLVSCLLYSSDWPWACWFPLSLPCANTTWIPHLPFGFPFWLKSGSFLFSLMMYIQTLNWHYVIMDDIFKCKKTFIPTSFCLFFCAYSQKRRSCWISAVWVPYKLLFKAEETILQGHPGWLSQWHQNVCWWSMCWGHLHGSCWGNCVFHREVELWLSAQAVWRLSGPVISVPSFTILLL